MKKIIKLFIQNSIKTFKKLNMNNFLYLHPTEQINLNKYNYRKYIIGQLKVVNDSAKRSIKLIQDCNENNYKS